MTCTRQMAHVSHSTSQLHMATAFHFFSENILSAPPALEPEEPACGAERPGSSPSSTSAMTGGAGGCDGSGPAWLLKRPVQRSAGSPRRQAEATTEA